MTHADDRIASPEAILTFWLEAGYEKWFGKNEAFDIAIRTRFLATYEAAAGGRLGDWEKTADGALALTIALDQFPRNMFRSDPRSYATDALARAVAKRAVAQGFDRKVVPDLRSFFYLPLMHSEDLADQEQCLSLYRELGDAVSSRYAEEHADIIRRFGRFPHRNAVLGRATTPEEQAFLDGGGFKG
ncbi:MAG: DUF924 family protein [Pseudorhodoplanes sp.]